MILFQDFIGTLDESLVRKLAIRSLRRGIGSMDYIESLLIMEDDLDEDEDLGEFGQSLSEQSVMPQADSRMLAEESNPEVQDSATSGVVDADQCHKKLKINVAN